MKNIKKSLRIVFWGLWHIFAIIGICVVVSFLFLMFDREGYCLSEEHGVWDNEQKICRHDCLKWSKTEGCVPLTADEKINTKCNS